MLIGLIVFAAWREPPRRAKPERLDRTGLVLLVSGVSMLIFAVMQGPDWGWTAASILLPLIAGAVLLVGFAIVERRIQAPLIEVGLFADASFSACNLLLFTAQYSKMAVFVFGALYLQEILELSPLMAGLALLPTVATQPFTAPLVGHASDRFGARWPALGGVAFLLVGLAWIGVASALNDYAWLFPGLVIRGLSIAFLFVPPQNAIMNSVPVHKQGQAGGIAMTSQLLGAAVGMAVCSTIFSMTNDYQVVFVANATFVLIVLIIAWFSISAVVAGNQQLRAKTNGSLRKFERIVYVGASAACE